MESYTTWAVVANFVASNGRSVLGAERAIERPQHDKARRCYGMNFTCTPLVYELNREVTSIMGCAGIVNCPVFIDLPQVQP